MKKRKLFIGIAVAMASIALAGCNNDTKTSSQTPTTIPTTAPTVAPTTKPTTVVSTPGSTVVSTTTPTVAPTTAPTVAPTTAPTVAPTVAPTTVPTQPTSAPTVAPTTTPTSTPTTVPVVQENPIEMNGVAYDTITAALAAIPTSGDTSTYTIKLNKGTYAENGLSYNGTASIRIVGNTDTKYGSDVIIRGRGSNMSAMRARELLEVRGTGNLILENIKLESDYSRAEVGNNAQAEVLGTDNNRNAVAYNCSFISHQDTLRTAGKAWFYGCYVEGDTDFIWMNEDGAVALYENCEIVSVWDSAATTHVSYVAAPRMNIANKVGKGLVFLNSTVKESDEAKANGQKTYLARTPWSSGYYNQVAYINTECSDIELSDGPWYKTQIATDYPKTIIGWKMDTNTAASLGLASQDYIIDDAVTAVEFNGRQAILNRIYNTAKAKYEKDTVSNWDINSIITEYGFDVTADESSDLLEGEIVCETTTYNFDGTIDQSALCSGFAVQEGKPHYVGSNGSTITIPVTGKSYVTVYGYYAGTMEAQAEGQGESVMFFDNGSTSKFVENNYVVYDDNVTSVVLTAKATTYITKVVVEKDPTIVQKEVTDINITQSTNNHAVGVALVLTAAVNADATNKSVKWTSSNEEVGKIDIYTGKVTFVSAGEVTFTATACDGSGVQQTVTCNPIEATWTAAEWYTTDQTLDTEDGALEIGNFSVNSSSYKALSSAITYTNLSGQSFTTSCGLKLNGSGMLTVATTNPATLTVVIGQAGKATVEPKVTDGTNVVAATAYTSGDLSVFVYRLETTGTWNIVRPGGSEVNPIVYAKIEYDATWNFQTATPSEITAVNIQGTTADVKSNVDGVSLTVDATCTNGKLAYNASGYAQFNSGTIIKVPVKNVGSVITVVAYRGQSKYTIGSGDNMIAADTSTDTDVYTVTEADVTAGYVEIIATGGAYIYSISLTNPR